MIQIQVRKSKISGMGLFALTSIEPGVVLFRSFDVSKHGYVIEVSPNSFVNHSIEPNLMSVIVGKDIYKASIRYIRQGEELTSDYNQTATVLESMGISRQSAGIEMSFETNPQAAQAIYEQGRKFYEISRLPYGTIITINS